MKKQFLYSIAFLFLVVISASAKDAVYFSYGPEGKNQFAQAEDRILVKFQEGMTFSEKSELLSKFSSIKSLEKGDVLPAPDVSIVRLDGLSEAETEKLIASLNQNTSVQYANPFMIYEDGTYQGIQDRVIVRLKSTKDLSMLNSVAKDLNMNVLERNEFDPLVYVLQTTKQSSGNALAMANRIHESGAFEYAEPDFLLLLKRFNTNDGLLDYQWSLNNTGSSLQYNGTAGADMNVFNAWSISTGSSSIKVAIIDEGVDLNHPDLQANLLGGYDATGQGSGGHPSGDDAHGTACAGIVAAAGNNNLGVAGVAYNAKIIPVRIAYSSGTSWVTSNTWIGNALNWAWDNAGADVLSNSWGGGSSSSTINNAINGAVNNGRGGLGAPVLFAAGNDNGANSYPATQTNVISVIAMSMCYERKNPSSCDGENWWGSNYGTGADVCAPGVKIATTDISGSSGYETGDYTGTFNGTSSATPNTSGVMALILSANPNLTEAQARFALESTCRKVGSYTYNSGVSGQPAGTWSNDLGYGLVDAYSAVLSVSPQVADDAGISSVNSPDGTICATSAIPSLTLNNYGSNTLSSATINYQLDAGAVNTYNWTGSLASASSTTVNLASINFSGGSHTFSAWTSNPNGNSDNTPSNDAASSSFSSASNGVTLSITFDNYPEETSWQVLDGSTVLASGGTYASQADGSTLVTNLCLPDGCFDFVINDVYGDGICCSYGSGSYTLTADVGGATLASGGTFTSSESTNFCVTSSNPLVASISGSGDVFCNGGSDGSATASASGGVTPYSYSWSNGATGATASGLTAGSYTVTVTDGNSDQAQANVTISAPSALSASASSNDVNCFGQNDGSASASASGGTAPYSYSWSNGGSGSSITGLTAGSYSVTVTDANGCTANANTSIGQPSLLTSSATSSDASCNGGSDGSVNLSVSGGSPSYSYAWSNGASTQDLNGVAAGSYSVTITDANGCSDVAFATIGQPGAMSLSTSSADASCNGGSDGSASVSASGGASPYSYSWSNGSSSAAATGLTAGSYSVTVTDANGCSANANVSVGEPSAVSANASSSDVSCNGGSDGSASVSASGGTAPYSYSWSNGGTTSSISGVAAGSYSVTVTDANGCTANTSASVAEPSALSSSASSSDVSCNGGNDGSASASASGGTAPYSYSWSNGGSGSSISGLAAGSYSVTITDANGCTGNSNTSVGEPSSLSASASSSDASCNGASDGSLNSSVSGGTAPYSYSWSNGSTSANVSGVAAGSYSLTVTDANGCTANANASIGQPSAISASATSSDASCGSATDGSVDLTVSGGNAPYSYSWSNGASTEDLTAVSAGSYSVTVTDANGCTANANATVGENSTLASTITKFAVSCFGGSDGSASVTASGGTAPYSYLWSNGATTASATGLSGGAYSVVVTDAAGCTSDANTIIYEPSALTSSTSSSDVSCNGGADGSASVSASGGTAPYSYSWSNGGTSGSITGLSVGSYSVTVTDANGCTANTNTSVSEPSALSASASASDASCNGGNGSVSLSVSGGTSPYSYSWSNGSTSTNLSSVAAGSYLVTITDANGCTANANATVGEPTALSASASGSDVSCNGGSDGSASGSASGGTAPYSYSWSNGGSGTSISALAAGSYTMTVTDANGCSANANATVGQPSALSASASATDATCETADGSASASVSGGTAPYSYSWSNGATGSAATGLLAGSYTVTVTDANGCTANAGATVGEDCGGCTYVSIDNNNFEGGWGIWNDGGSDVALVSNSSYANSGSYSIQLRDNSGAASAATTNNLNLSNYSEVTIAFSYYPTSMENGEDFWLQISTNGGGSFTTIGDWNANAEFVNNQRYNESVVYAGTFTANTQIRFQCDASGNSDWIYIDDVVITGCQGGPVLPTCTDGIQNGDEEGIDCGGTSCSPCATCSDGIQNGDEEGVDCGGSSCAPCSSGCAYVGIDSNDFEGGWGIWNDGGTDCSRSSNGTYAYGGTYSIMIRDNSGVGSSTTTNALDLTTYDEVTVDFVFKANGMENGEDFWLQYATGTSYTTVAAYAAGSSFVNGNFYAGSVVIPGPFSAGTTFRFRCDASANDDQIYLDNVVISGCKNGSSARLADPTAIVNETHETLISNVNLYPNPTSDVLNIDLELMADADIQLRVMDISGKLVFDRNITTTEGSNKITIQSSDLPAGVYVMSIVAETEMITKRFVVQH